MKPTKEQTRDKFTLKLADVVILKNKGKDVRPPEPPLDPAQIKLPNEKEKRQS